MKKAIVKSNLTALLLILPFLLIIPLIGNAGNLEPADPPDSTMNTLEDIYYKPVWKMLDKTFVDWKNNSRFAVCDNGTTEDESDDMVLDKETGLIWPRNGNLLDEGKEWDKAVYCCRNDVKLGNRMGWRLPTVEEMCSLLDTSQSFPALPNGHPFINVQTGYWTCTTDETDSTKVYGVTVATKIVVTYPKLDWGGISVWPVRGGSCQPEQ